MPARDGRIRSWALAVLGVSALALARAPNYPAAAQRLDAAIAAAKSGAAGQGLVVVYYDEDDAGVSRGVGREWVTLDGERVGRFARDQRYVIVRAPAGAHSIGIDAGRAPLVRRVVRVAEGSRSYLRYVRSVQPTAARTFLDSQVANLTSLDPIEEDVARGRIATIDALAATW